MSRYKITDKQWGVFAPYLERKNTSKVGRPQRVENRQMFEGTLWILGSGAPWRDLPTRFGPWQTVYKQFSRWAKLGVLEELLQEPGEGREDDFSSMDSSIVKVHKHGSAPVGGQKKESIGRSRGGITTKIHAVTDSLDKPIKILLTAGNVHDSKPALELVDVCTSQAVLADKAYGSRKILSALQEKSMVAVIPPKSNTVTPWKYDKYLYQERHSIECFFQKIKEYRRIATRYDKLQVIYKAFIIIATNLIWLK